ncbi:MAG: HAD-IIB family hydrolase [Candidatus Moeniiplasma glomeromycotorum]|nr:HAD-IIB family hydrolase [Candidatus Moeniiplasma glomeromycotorum]MCE8162182.1 HAD-IIB family hydrolase [Candidatus Moeniiplasma glomeromycotorum]MCE8166162.1 HAD-IIB family hydrolase [Candidatus Moeniiplasma glomeromycotorum]MCE8166581.1 HAD-IIB family hydrolase [Candidatus Moeniiplasma glomeromycotorum]
MNINSITINKEIHLIKLDIDGTSTNADFSTLNENLKKILQKLKEQGHKICFTTGRNYWSALPFYNEVGLDTFLVTYNGAYINNPAKQNDKEVVMNQISNQVVRDILAEPIVKQNLLNFLVDDTSKKIISTSNDIYYQEIFFNGNSYTKADISNLLEHLGEKDILQLVLEFPNEKASDKEIFYNILVTLNSKYGEGAITFYFGSKLKAKNPGDKILVPDPTRKIIKIRSKMASKGRGAEWVAGYYNIPLARTMAFGNDVNDIEMMHTVGKGVVMADSDPSLIPFARGITDFGLLNSDGVAKHLKEYFNLK